MFGMNLLKMIENDDIEFLCKGKKIVLDYDKIAEDMTDDIKKRLDWGGKGKNRIEYVIQTAEDLACYSYEYAVSRNIVDKSDGYVTIVGSGLEKFLSDKANLFELASFIDVSRRASCEVKKLDCKFHVLTDVDKVNKAYNKEQHRLVNLLGTVHINADDWVPYLTEFEKELHFSICNSHMETGYEYPRTEEEFEYKMLNHASFVVVGTKEQLLRYRSLPCLADLMKDKDHVSYVNGIVRNIEDMLSNFA